MDIEKVERGSPVAKSRGKDVPPLAKAESSHIDSVCWSRTKRVWRIIYDLTASHVGLAIILVTYSVAGAFIFSFIEEPHESEGKADVIMVRGDIVDRVLNMSGVFWTLNETMFSQILDAELQVYQDMVERSYDGGISISTEEVVWTFWGALFFCVSTYTTIGKTSHREGSQGSSAYCTSTM